MKNITKRVFAKGVRCTGVARADLLKKACLTALLLVPMLLFGCAQNQPPEPTVHDTPVVETPGWQATAYPLKGLKLVEPMGVQYSGQRVYICDAGAGDVKIYDKSLAYQGKIGSLGNAPGQFITPTDIAVVGDFLYVLDGGNNRLQRLQGLDAPQPDGEYSLLDFAPQNGAKYAHLEVLGADELYFTTTSLPHGPQIYRLEKGQLTGLKPTLHGAIAQQGGKLYAIDTLEMMAAKGNSLSAQSGENSLYSLEGKKLKPVATLPGQYTICDFLAQEDGFYVLSASLGRLDYLDATGQYQNTIARFENPLDIEARLARDDTGAFYVTDSRNGVIHKIENTTAG